MKRLLLLLVFLSACTQETPSTTTIETPAVSQFSTKEFLEKSNQKMADITASASRAEWVQANFITEDTTKIVSEYDAKYSETVTQLAMESKVYTPKSDIQKRQLDLMLKILTVPAPSDPKLNQELALLKSELGSLYGSGKYCKDGECKTLGDLSKIIAKSRNPKELLEAWDGWRTIAFPMKEKFKRTVQYGNKGAQEIGFTHMADFWRSKYDMKPDAFEKEMDRLWMQVKPLYDQLHCFVRGKLNKKYGNDVVPLDKPIAAHLLGNMWAQSWENISDIVGLKEGSSIDMTKLLERAKYNPEKMVRTAENFFVSLGMPNLPKTFYERSLFEKPQDREVVCHASAWHMDNKDDVRIKMCIENDEDNFRTIHHELGHIYYYLAYKDLPIVFQGSAHYGFHEALGDTIELSITPNYLKEIGLLKKSAKISGDANQALLKMALVKVAFLPFGLMMDKWRWQVLDGRTTYENYNNDWWKLREQYQGVRAPNIRPSEAFDPGAKYHIPSYTTYSRYFLAHILQFQLHKALCETAGHTGPLHECSIFNNKEAGQKLWNMMKLGKSRPWTQALKAATGEEQMNATALIEYFEPLSNWLKQQNGKQKCGW